MTYTENYELPLIEGTDVIDYAPYNESMGKIDEALNTMGDNVQEAKDDVAEMGDTLTQKMGEVDQALQDTVDNVNASLEQTTQDLNDEVDSKLGRISKFVLARYYEVPDDTYLYGGESGYLILPITSVSPTLNRIEGVSAPTNNRFKVVPTVSASGTPVSKIDIDFEVEQTGGDGTFDINKYTKIELMRNDGGGGNVVAEQYINTSVRTPIHFTYLATGSGITEYLIRLSSPYSCKLLGNMAFTIENIGMNN